MSGMNIRLHGWGGGHPICQLYFKYFLKEVWASAFIRTASCTFIMFFATMLADNFVRSERQTATVFFRLGIILTVLVMSGYFGLQARMRNMLKPLLAALPFSAAYWLLLDSCVVGTLLLCVMAPFLIYLYSAQQLFYMACWPLWMTLPFAIAGLYCIQNYTEKQSVVLTASLGILWGFIILLPA